MNASEWSPRVPSMFEKRMLNVLLVDHDPNVHHPILDILQHFFLKVISVKYASTGLSILSRGSPKIDVVIENIMSPDLCGFKLLQEAVERDLHVILLLEEYDCVLTKMALEAGALICITKPVSMEMADCLGQIVVGENLRRIRNNMNIQEQSWMETTSYDMINDATNSEETTFCISSANHHNMNVGNFTTKVWTEWTQELHDLFMNAVRTLGEGKCYPKDILELMNVPGLTRMQVASHLQKCRRGNWIPPSERKAKVTGANRDIAYSNSRRFGLMPRSGTANADSHHTNINNVDVGDQITINTHTSLLNQNNNYDEYCYEFTNTDSIIIGGFCPINYAVDSNLQVPAMNNSDVDGWEGGREAYNVDANAQIVIKEEEEY